MPGLPRGLLLGSTLLLTCAIAGSGVAGAQTLLKGNVQQNESAPNETPAQNLKRFEDFPRANRVQSTMPCTDVGPVIHAGGVCIGNAGTVGGGGVCTCRVSRSAWDLLGQVAGMERLRQQEIAQKRQQESFYQRYLQSTGQARPASQSQQPGCSPFSTSQQVILRRTGIEALDTAAAAGQQADHMLQAFGETLAGSIAELRDPQAFTTRQRANLRTMLQLLQLPNAQFQRVLQGAAGQELALFMRDPSGSLGRGAAAQVLAAGVGSAVGAVCKATASTAARAMQTAGAAANRLRTLARRFAAALPPIKRGMALADDYAFRNLARENGWIIVVRNSNPAAMRWVGHPDALPKPMELKAKSIPYDPTKPFSQQPYAGLASARDLTKQELDALQRAGYIPDPARGDILVKNGKVFYSDTDLGGVYDANGGNVWPQMSQELEQGLIKGLNEKFVDNAVQHGPHDVYPGRLDPGNPNYGPQVGNGKSVTIYVPDGSAYQISTLPEMREFYASRGIDFARIYPQFAGF